MADEENEEGGGGGKKKLIIIIVVVLLVLIGLAVGLMMMSGPEEEVGTAPADQAATGLEEDIASSSQSEAIKMANPVFTPPRKYTVNLRDGKHFLSITLVAALEDPNALMYLAKREYMIDDMVISFLQNLTTDDLRSRAGTELVKRELFKKVNGIFDQEFIENSDTNDRMPVKKILVTQFILN